MKKELKDLDGNEIKESNAPNVEPLTLGKVMINALLAPHQQDANGIDPEKAMHRWNIARRIRKVMEDKEVSIVELPAEDVALVKKRIPMYYTVGVIGPAFEAIESPPEV